jgi:Spy/CpxP family protein refolding chaperone
MKRTLQMVSAAVLLTVASVTAQAQGGGGMGGGMGRGGGMAAQREAMFKDITLTPAQTMQVDTVMKMSQEKMAAARASGTPMTPEDRKKMTEDRTAAIKKILTADQATQFEKNMAAMMAGRGRGASL